MLALPPDHDHAHRRVAVERLEGRAQKRALRHPHDIERRPVEHDVRTLVLRVGLDAESVGLNCHGR